MNKDKQHDTDRLFKETLETHREPVSADVWTNIETHFKKRASKEKDDSATRNDTRQITPPGESKTPGNNKVLKEIFPKRFNSVWEIFGSFLGSGKADASKKPSSIEEIQNLNDIDKLFKEAASDYPLNQSSSSWEKLCAKMNDEQACNQTKNKPAEFLSTERVLEELPIKQYLNAGEIKLMPSTFKNKNYWKRYPLHTSPETIERCVSFEVFYSEGKPFELLRFYKSFYADNILISPGIGEHAFVFAELAFLIHRKGYNVFVLPKHGAVPFLKLIRKHQDAALYIKTKYSGDLHLYGKGLGGFSVLHLALAETINLKTIICENAPVLFSGNSFAQTMNSHRAAGNRNSRLLPFLKSLVKYIPWLTVPVNRYMSWARLTDFSHDGGEKIEKQLIKAYSEDPDFDQHYPLKSVMSVGTAPLPKNISFLSVPVMFILAKTGISPEYFESLYKEIYIQNKRLEKLEGGFFWMVSNPEEAAQLIVSWLSHQKNKTKNEQPVN